MSWGRPLEAGDWEALGRLVPRLESAARRLPFARRESGRGRRVPAEFGEFREHAPYTPGEDLRRFDWAVYARLRRPVVRRFDEVERRALLVLVDKSASTALRWPGFAFLAGLYARLARSVLDEVVVHAGGRRVALAGDGREEALFGLLAAPGDGRLEPERFLSVREPGLGRAGVLVLSDFEPEDLWARALERAAQRGLRPSCVFPRLPLEAGRARLPAGPVRLVDPETGRAAELVLDEDLGRRFRAEQSAWERRFAARLAVFGRPFVAADLPDPSQLARAEAWAPFLAPFEGP